MSDIFQFGQLNKKSYFSDECSSWNLSNEDHSHVFIGHLIFGK